MGIVLLAALALQDSVERALERLHSDDIAERARAEIELALLGDPAAAPLETLALGSDPELRARAKTILAMIERGRRLPSSLARRLPRLLRKDHSLFELLSFDLLEGERAFFARRAARDLRLPPAVWYRTVWGHAGAEDLAAAALRGPAPELRAYALAALQEVDPAGAVRLAASLLRSSSPDLRVQAAWTLGEAGPPSAAGDLKTLLRDPVPAVAESAAWAIRRLAPAADIRIRAAPPAALPRADQLLIFAKAVDRRDVAWREGADMRSVAWTDVRAALESRLDPAWKVVLRDGEARFERRGK